MFPLAIGAVVVEVPTTCQTPLSGHFSPVLAVDPMDNAILFPFKVIVRITSNNVLYRSTFIIYIKNIVVKNKMYCYSEQAIGD